MKKLLLISLLLLSLSSQAQRRSNYERDNTGLAITAGGVILCTISLFVNDGGEFTYSNGYNSTRITKSWYQCPNRTITFGVGVILSIGGLIYQYNNK